MKTASWRIDDLAQRAGITVDTVRYYTREGLLPAPERAGRNKLYGPDHLERLERIRDLQDRRFSLAAIRALLEADRPGLDGIFGNGSASYTLEELCERAGVERAICEQLGVAGLLPDPARFGRDGYDASDLRALQAIDELHAIGLPHEMLVELVRIYVRNFDVIQHEVLDMFAGRSGAATEGWDPAVLHAVQDRLSLQSGRLISAVDRLLEYIHQRTLQRMTLDAIRRNNESPR